MSCNPIASRAAQSERRAVSWVVTELLPSFPWTGFRLTSILAKERERERERERVSRTVGQVVDASPFARR